MQFFAALAMLGTAAAMVEPAPTGKRATLVASFHAYTQEHGKVYSSEEFNERLEIFADNLQMIERHNAEATKGLHSFQLGVGPFTDMTHEEWVEQMNFVEFPAKKTNDPVWCACLDSNPSSLSPRRPTG